MNKLNFLQTIETLAEELGFYGYISEEALEHELTVNGDKIFVASNICAYFSDQDGGEASDELFEAILEEL